MTGAGSRRLHPAELGLPVVLAVGLVLMTRPAAAQPGAVLIRPEQAVSLALAGNRQIRAAELELEKARGELAVARSRRLPVLGLNLMGAQLLTPVEFEFRKGSLGELPGLGPFPATDAAVTAPRRFTTFVNATLTQPLSQQRRIRLGMRLQAAEVELAREQLRLQRLIVTADVRGLYLALVQVEAAVRTSEVALTFLRELERTVSGYVEAQTALPGDLLEVRVRRARQEHDTLKLRNELAGGKEKLNALLGRDLRTAFRVVEEVPALPDEADLEGLQRKALERRPELRQADLKVRQASLARDIERAGSMPDFSLQLSYLQPYNLQVLPDRLFTLGVSLTWEPFDWGRRRQRVQQREKAIEQAHFGKADLEARILAEVGAAHRKLTETRAMVNVTRLAHEAAVERLRIAKDRYAAGLLLLKDVLELQAALAEADRQARTARVAVLAAQSELERAVGGWE